MHSLQCYWLYVLFCMFHPHDFYNCPFVLNPFTVFAQSHTPTCLAASCLSLYFPPTWLSLLLTFLGGRAGVAPGHLASCFAAPDVRKCSQSFCNVCGNIIKVNAEGVSFVVEERALISMLNRVRLLEEPSCSVIDAPFSSLCSLISKSTNRLLPERLDAGIIFPEWAPKRRFFGERCV